MSKTNNQNTDQIKLFGTILVTALGAAWLLFSHLDNKIDQKSNYLNSRIDHILAKEQP